MKDIKLDKPWKRIVYFFSLFFSLSGLILIIGYILYLTKDEGTEKKTKGFWKVFNKKIDRDKFVLSRSYQKLFWCWGIICIAITMGIFIGGLLFDFYDVMEGILFWGGIVLILGALDKYGRKIKDLFVS